MRVQCKPPQKMLGFKASEEFRAFVERLAATLTLKRQRRVTFTDVFVEGIELLAKKEKVS